jgi:dienelactone hydrolase
LTNYEPIVARPASLRLRIFSPFRRAARWIANLWRDIKPGPEARKGALWAAIATVIWAAIIGGINLKSGFGIGVDLLFAFVIAALGIPLVAAIFVLLLAILRRLPRWTSGVLVGALMFIALLFFGSFGLSVAAILLFIEASLGATVATLLAADFPRLNVKKKVATVSVCVLAIAANIGIFMFLHNDGVNEKLIEVQQNTPAPAALNAPNPADRGSYIVRHLIYGAGTDIRRPEFGKSIALRTSTVDASAFFKDFEGWKASLRKRYWGFGMDKLPLNGRVWYPAGAGPFPLVLMVHGNHTMSEFSDPGYAYLGELLASRGFIFVSLDENFLNSGLFHEPPKQQSVRGWLLLEHLKVWQKWNQAAGNPFYGKVDWNNIALMGHSRGGEAAATAALFNKLAYYPDDATITFHYGFPIKAIVAIAPADGQYKPAGQWRTIEDVNYFTIQGANDSDVSSFMGSRQWDHIRFTGAPNFFKSELYIYRANHGQFNTVWGRTDAGAPMNWFLNLHPLLTGEDQRRIAKIYISAFLEATLHSRREYVPLFQDYRRVRNLLPRTLYINRYQDSTDHVIANFNEDADVTTTTSPGGHITASI